MLELAMGKVAPCSGCVHPVRTNLLRTFRSDKQLSDIRTWRCCYSTAALSSLRSQVPTIPAHAVHDHSSSHGPPAKDHSANVVIHEAVKQNHSPHHLRLLLVSSLVNDKVDSPITVWRKFHKTFAWDYIHESDNINIGLNRALEEISRELETHGKSLGVYGLPLPEFRSREVDIELSQWNTGSEVLAARAATAVSKLNAEQDRIYTEIQAAVSLGQPLCAFVDGKAGRGKTYLVNAICNNLRSQGRIVLPTATSAFAAQLYPGGKTAHSVFKVPVSDGEMEKLVSPIQAHDPRGELIREAAVIIWDEAPMANRAVLQCVEETCRRVMRNDLPFGGKVVILLGDFRQTCPIVRHGTRRRILDASILSSPVWQSFSVYRLTQPIRNAEDLPFADFVDTIGDGGGPTINLDMLHKVRDRNELIDFVYPQEALDDPVMCLKRAILAPTNEQVDSYNDEILSRINGLQRTFSADDSLLPYMRENDGTIGKISPESVLDDVLRHPPPGIPAHELTLKVNGVYRLMCNFFPARGLVKNTRVVVIAIGKRIVTVRILRGLGGASVLDSEDILISKIPLTTSLDSGHKLVRRQFPLAPAYATTFNSCQGLTLDVVGVDLTRPVFAHGQLYTALSRIRHRTHAKVRLPPGWSTTMNVTYRELIP